MDVIHNIRIEYLPEDFLDNFSRCAAHTANSL